MSSSDILKEMIDAATPKVTSCSSAINQIDVDVASLTAQANAIKEGMMDVIAADVDHYLNHIWDTTSGDFAVTFGSTYNLNAPNGTLTDWYVYDTTTSEIVYQYHGIGWDDDQNIEKSVANWNWALDYLWRDMGFSGTYGIYDKIEKLNMGRGVLVCDLNKYSDSITKFAPFAST